MCPCLFIPQVESQSLFNQVIPSNITEEKNQVTLDDLRSQSLFNQVIPSNRLMCLTARPLSLCRNPFLIRSFLPTFPPLSSSWYGTSQSLFNQVIPSNSAAGFRRLLGGDNGRNPFLIRSFLPTSVVFVDPAVGRWVSQSLFNQVIPSNPIRIEITVEIKR